MSFVSKQAKIKKGAIICPFVTITSNCTIGVNFQANIYSYVAHDCIIGDNVTFAPAVKCNGNVIIGNNVYIGTGAIIHQGRTKPLIIEDNSIIAAGAVVNKNVKTGQTVFGNPAIELTKENFKKRLKL
ncbi:acetyltransferase [Campylobacter peloridis]|uniref:Acetyltransferase n=1 Tax=Campylobacter peloridis TaxID=488546 RepID=A0A5C7DNU7_9BACT|nr:acetyltransferase [Campylobacter peloridis]TXE81326.1 acetyltransferase [Campylobacter peloridis]